MWRRKQETRAPRGSSKAVGLMADTDPCTTLTRPLPPLASEVCSQMTGAGGFI